jgi:hypothetical protein
MMCVIVLNLRQIYSEKPFSVSEIRINLAENNIGVWKRLQTTQIVKKKNR